MCVRKSMAFLLVLLVVSSWLWAFPGRKQQKELAIQEEFPEEVIQISSEPEAKTESSVLRTDSEELMRLPEETVTAELDSADIINNDAVLDELRQLLEEQVTDQFEAESDIERLRAQNEEISALNSSQADEIAYLKGRLDKELSSKFFADLKGIIGFRDKIPEWGIGGDIGIRFGSGLMISAGASYMIGSFLSPPKAVWDLDDLILSIGIGWEW